jgi:uncharacterized protein YjbJ (UPF0337 family)
MNSKDTRSSQDLRREVLNDLNKVNRDMDRIQNRMTPGQMIDDAIFYPQGSNPSATFDHLKRNPVGTTFLAVGTLLLMEDDQHRSYEAFLKQSGHDAYDLTRKKVSGTLAEARGKVEGVKGQFKEKVDQYRNRKDAEAAFDTGPSKLDKIKGAVSNKFGEVKESLSSSIDSIRGKVTAEFDSSQDSSTSSLSQGIESVKNLNPMTYIALGAGLGALSGAALPVSDKERTFVDQYFGSKLSQFTEEIQQALNESVSVLKEEFLSELKNVNVGVFKGQDDKSEVNQDSSAI